MTTLLQALCLVLVIEGAAIALFPAHLKEAAAMLMEMEAKSLRVIGLVALFFGACLLLLL